MSDSQPTPGQTLAVLLGASTYRYAPKLAHGPAFYNSSQQFAQYLIDTMGMPEENIASFFDEGRSAGDQLRDISVFLEHRTTELKNAGTPARDLIVHYVGHGLFSGGDNDYCLAIRATDEQNEGFTSIRMRDLASVIRNSATFMRKYLILDCCFSGAAYAQFQSGPLSVVQVKVRDVLDDESPQRGTSLLCSASAKDPSVAPRGLPRTMFSDSLLTILSEGHEAFGPSMSFTELGELVRIRIKETYRESGVRPEVHSPDQGSGDVARVRLFPNPAWAKAAAEKAETERLAEERAESLRQAKARAEAERKSREKAEAERLARERAEAERQAKAQAEAEQVAREKAEAKRLARERAEAERQAKAQAEAERIAREKAETERLARERAEAERQAKPRPGAEQIARQEAETKRLARERVEAERQIARQAAEAEKVARERALVERLANARAESARIAREKSETERLTRERAEAKAKEKAEAERRARQTEEEARQRAQAEHARAEAARKAAEEAAAEGKSVLRRVWLTSIAAPVVALCSAGLNMFIGLNVTNSILNFILKAIVCFFAGSIVVGIGVDKIDKSPKRGRFAIIISICFGLGYWGFQLLGVSYTPSWGWGIASCLIILSLAAEPTKK